MNAKNVAVLLCILVNIIFVLVLTGIIDISGIVAEPPKEKPPKPKPQPIRSPIKTPNIPPPEDDVPTLVNKIAAKYNSKESMQELIHLKSMWQHYRDEVAKIEEENSHANTVTTTVVPIPKRARLVTIVTDETLEEVLSFLGSVHKHYPPHQDMLPSPNNHDSSETKLQVTVYGLGVSERISSQLTLIKHVEFVDAYDIYVKLEELEKPKMKPIVDQWRPLVIFHAVNKYGKVIYVDPSRYIAKPLTELEKALDERGAVFMQIQGVSPVYAPDFENCYVGVQAFKAASAAYYSVLVPQIKCAFRVCTQDELKMFASKAHKEQLLKDETIKKQLQCTKEFNDIFERYTIDNGLKCDLIKRDDLVFGQGMLPGSKIHELAKTKKNPNDGRIHVALGFPSTSKGTENPTVLNTPFMTTFLPTFLKTIRKDETKYYYKLYLGFDTLDPFFDNAANQKAYKEEVAKHIAGYPVSFDMLRVTYSRGWVVYLWNALFHHAIENGADYFYQLNDDISFITPDWTDPMVTALKQSRVPDVGVVSPTDKGNPNTFTQALVSKKHYDIFGTFYPVIFENWFSDDWITHVYVKQQMAYKLSYELFNAQVAGTRYSICSAQGPHRLAVSVAVGEQMIAKYLQEHK